MTRRGERALLATAFLFYRDAPEAVREWTRRRHQRFSRALSAATAVILGMAAGAIVTTEGKRLAIAADGGLAPVVVRTMSSAYQQRSAADRMEAYWFRLMEAGLDPRPDDKAKAAKD